MIEMSPIRRRKLYEEVVIRLEEEIHRGNLRPGDVLPPERELMLQFGVGRPAIREALFALQRMGLVIVTNGERAKVSNPTPKTLLGELSGAARMLLSKPEGVRNFQQARALFESALAREAAQLATGDDLHMLGTALTANEAAIGDHAAFIRTDIDFHLAIASIPRNPIYLALHEAIVEWLVDQRDVSLRRAGTDRLAFESHRRIFEAIEAHDATAAWQAMRDHLHEISDRYWRVKEGRG